jgi:RNA recognition motif-containing protein
MVKLFVSGFPLDMEEIELVKMLSLHGDVKTIKLVRDKKTRVCKGYGFVEVADQASAESIIAALHGEPLADRRLTVTIRPEEEEKKPAPSYRPSSSRPPVYQKVARPSDPDFKKKRPRRGV